MNILSALYGRATQIRRQRYSHRPDRQRRLRSLVFSVGNLSVGGSGKTPVVQALARLLQDVGEAPAVLSRGYGRTPADGILVVSDIDSVRITDAAQSGDEPQMLARRLPGVPVVVAADRYAAGRLSEQRFQTTVQILDDGFQHLQLARDVDLLVVPPADLDDAVLPAGRLREPLAAARGASAVLVPGSEEDAARVAAATGVADVFRIEFVYEALRAIGPGGAAEASGASGATEVVAVAGIARPQRFVDALQRAGWTVRDQVLFADHHRYSARDVERIESVAKAAGVSTILTTEKDAVRLESFVVSGFSRTLCWAVLPMSARVLPAHGPAEAGHYGLEFRDWVVQRLREARA